MATAFGHSPGAQLSLSSSSWIWAPTFIPPQGVSQLRSPAPTRRPNILHQIPLHQVMSSPWGAWARQLQRDQCTQTLTLVSSLCLFTRVFSWVSAEVNFEMKIWVQVVDLRWSDSRECDWVDYPWGAWSSVLLRSCGWEHKRQLGVLSQREGAELQGPSFWSGGPGLRAALNFWLKPSKGELWVLTVRLF